ncbi:hypothetical protein JCM8097_006670 [Rhodosporidiobolus ruineniae]
MPPRPHADALAPTPLDPPGRELPLPGSRSAPAPLPDPTNVAQRPGDGTDVGLLVRKIGLAGVSNMTAALFTNPADLVKVRQQLQLKSVSKKTGQEVARSTNAFSTLVSMVRAEGLGSIYKGLTGSLLREGCYSGIRMGSYDLWKSTLIRSGIPGVADNPNGFGTKLAAGMASGMVGAAIANPADLLKVRMQAPSATGTLRDHFHDIMRSSGIKGLYKAVFPTTIRAGILTSSQLGCYDGIKHMLKRDFPAYFTEGFRTHLAASAVAGFCCSVASNPVDVIKVRMMTDKTGQYSNAFHCAALLLKNEGPLSFMKGFSMCFARLWPHSLVSLVVFEQLRKAVGMEAI